MLRKTTELPVCSVTNIIWYRYVVSSSSLVIVVIRLPRSSKNSADCGHQAPFFRWRPGRRNAWQLERHTSLFLNGCLVVEVSWRCDAAYISETVTSQVSGLPRVHGTRVAPSGLLPSALDSPMCSLLSGICTFLSTRQLRSLSCEWRMWRGSILRQASPCKPLVFDCCATYACVGWQTRIASSGIRRPMAVSGVACSQ